MKLSINDYKTLVFDCDGVVLNSNKVKTDAFYKAALPYGKDAAEALVHYHVSNGGVSRYKKFAYFLENVVGNESESALRQLLDDYASYVRDGLLSCERAEGLEELRNSTSDTRWLIVSGGDQVELREIFKQRGIHLWFDGGIFGSPDAKEDILAREIDEGNISKPALFLGDSKYDYKAAQSAQLDFVFLNGWSEMSDWQEWVSQELIICKESVRQIQQQAFHHGADQ